MIDSSVEAIQDVFPTHIADEVARRPELLQPQTRELSILFADLRGFTALSAKMSPSESDELLSEVLEALTDEVMQREGVVIDYYGDGLFAMWNAPLDVAGHGNAASAAALGMLEAIPKINRSRGNTLPAPLALRIGIHTGEAQVGNSGTRQRFKYGPRGFAVNLASRVEAAARRLDVPLLVTDATRRQLGDDYFTLKVCTAKLPGIAEPRDLYTVYPAARAEQLKDKLERYVDALRLFETGELVAAETLLNELANEPGVAPAGFLAEYTSALLRGGLGRRATDPVGEAPDSVIEILAK